MARVIVGVTAWLAGTALAVTVAWFGADAVLANTGMNPGLPVVVAASATPSGIATAAAAPSAPAASSASGLAPAVPSASTSGPAVTPSPSPTAASTSGAQSPARNYALTGGHVTLDVTATSVKLVTAVPDPGYAVQTWSGTGWLRVDFSSGPQVSSLIASWYEHAPSITVTN